MNYLDAIFLGIVQGLTEFLPVSSSGHLVIAEALLKVKQPGVTFELVVHLGTLIAVMLYFRRQLIRLARSLYTREMVVERKIVLLLVIGTIPAGLAGTLLKDFFESSFHNPVQTCIELIITGFILLVPRLFRKGNEHPGWMSAAAMGVAQAVAILPGISRSGTTIATGLIAKVKPEEAAEFSFLLSIPAIAGAIILEIPNMMDITMLLAGPYLAAVLASFTFGLLAVYWVLRAVKKGKFEYFAFYCFAVGLLGLYLFL